MAVKAVVVAGRRALLAQQILCAVPVHHRRKWRGWYGDEGNMKQLHDQRRQKLSTRIKRMRAMSQSRLFQSRLFPRQTIGKRPFNCITSPAKVIPFANKKWMTIDVDQLIKKLTMIKFSGRGFQFSAAAATSIAC